MIKLVWRTDVHLSDTPPASRKDDWTATVLGKLRQVGSIATKVGASGVLDGGDFFHVKSPSRNSHDLVRATAEVHDQAYTVPVVGNVGNHDVVYGDYSYLDQQPLGVLFSTGVFLRGYDEHEVYFTTGGHYMFNRKTSVWAGDRDPFALTDRTDPIIRVVGVPYHGTTYDMERFRSIKKGKEDTLVCMAHVLASPSGGSMFEGEDILKYSDLEAFAPDVFCFGHWHKDQGVVTLGAKGEKTVINIGSLTRGALSQDEVVRRPGVAILSFDQTGKVTVQVVRLPVAPSSEVFDLVGRARVELRSSTMDTFVDSVRKRLLLEPDRDLATVLRGMKEVPDQVKERTLLYLERAG